MVRNRLAEKIMTLSGSVIFTTVKMKRAKTPGGGKRRPKMNPTVNEVLEINKKLAEMNLAIKLNYNFKPGDIHFQLTYRKEPTNAEAHKALEWVIKEFRKELKKLGIVLKAIYATEYLNKRLHHHIVMSEVDVNLVREIWKKYGDVVRFSILDDSRDYRALAHYIIKETEKTFRDPDAFSRRRYNCTRSIVTPDANKVEADPSDICDEPKAEKGYYIEKNSIYKGVNPFTGAPYVTYVQVSLDAAQPRLKTLRRGKKVRSMQNDYSGWLKRNMHRQMEMDLEDYSSDSGEEDGRVFDI